MMARTGTLTKPQWLGFFALCLLGASAWLVDSAWPSTLPGAEREGLHDLVIALVLCAVGWRQLVSANFRARPWLKLALASVCLLGVPAMVVGSTLGDGSGVVAAALFALLPVMVVVIVSYVGGAESSRTMRLLLPALIGLGGMLLLLPFAEPGSWRQAGLEAAVVAGVLVAAAASVWMYRLLPGFTVIEAALICSLANAVFSAVVLMASSVAARAVVSSGWGGWHALAIEAATAIFLGLPQVLLLVWLLREVAPARFAARYLVIPLLTVIEGYALLRPPIGWREIGGAALVIFAAWRLLTASQPDEEPGLMLH